MQLLNVFVIFFAFFSFFVHLHKHSRIMQRGDKKRAKVAAHFHRCRAPDTVAETNHGSKIIRPSEVHHRAIRSQPIAS